MVRGADSYGYSLGDPVSKSIPTVRYSEGLPVDEIFWRYLSMAFLPSLFFPLVDFLFPLDIFFSLSSSSLVSPNFGIGL